MFDGTNTFQSTSKIAFDFEDKQSQLNGQLQKILHSNNREMVSFVEKCGQNNALDYYISAFFPHFQRNRYFIANLSYDKYPYWIIRPVNERPSTEEHFPNGLGIGIAVGRKKGKFVVRSMVTIPISGQRDWEEVLEGYIYTDPSDYTDREILDKVSSFPSQALHTKNKLTLWYDYLNWVRTLMEIREAGLRYLKWDYNLSKNTLNFLVWGKEKKIFQDWRTLRSSRNGVIQVCSISNSQDPWCYTSPKKEGRFKRYPNIGEIKKQPQAIDQRELEDLGETLEENLPEGGYFFSLEVILDNEWWEDNIQSLEDLVSDEEDREKAAMEKLKDLVFSQGFLISPNVGDLNTVKVMSRALERLERDQGLAPYLSTYIFDISRANLPKYSIPEIEFSFTLNEAQQDCIRKMLEAPDICLVQGPPGTGKTTVIAEACRQFAKEGKRVLVVSQSNLAVDNALSRLEKDPMIRPIRLGKADRVSEEGESFVESNVVSYYFDSISTKLDQTWLKPWKNIDTEKENLDIVLEKLRFLWEDYESNNKALFDFKEKAQKCKEELDRLQNKQNQVNLQLDDLEEQLKEAERLRKFLEYLIDNDDKITIPISLPLNLLKQIVEHLIQKLPSLYREYQWWKNASYFENLVDTRESTTACLDALAAFFTLDQDIVSHFHLVLEQAESMGESNRAILPSDQRKLDELRKHLSLLAEKLDDDDSVLQEYRQTKKEIKKLEAYGWPKTQESLREIVSLLFFSIPTHIEEIANSLKFDPKFVFVLRKIKEEIQEIVHCRKNLLPEIPRFTENIVIQEIGSAKQNQKRLLKDLEHINEQTQRKKIEFEKVKWENKEKKKEQNQLILDWKKNCQYASEKSEMPSKMTIDLVTKRLDELKEKEEKSEAFRNSWEVLLNNFRQKLDEPSSADQEHFLPIYAQHCNVVGMTCSESGSYRILNNENYHYFDVVMIDEVSKATPPELLMPMLLGRKTILLGDHRQLPPLFKENEKTYEEMVEWNEENEESQKKTDERGISRNDFDKYQKLVTASLFQEMFENADPELKSSLNVQFRMHPQIQNVINQFYENQLVCGIESPDHSRDHGLTIKAEDGTTFLTPDRHVLWMDSSKDHHQNWVEEEQEGTSKINLLEIDMTMEMVKKLNKSLKEQGYGKNKKKEVGIITFYGKQLGRLFRSYQQLDTSDRDALDIRINTVDKFQGMERAIIIVSLVRSKKHIRKSKKAYIAQFQRVNVAFSRAQELLIILGAKNTYYEYPIELPNMNNTGKRTVKAYKNIIDIIQREGGLYTSDKLLPRSHRGRWKKTK